MGVDTTVCDRALCSGILIKLCDIYLLVTFSQQSHAMLSLLLRMGRLSTLVVGQSLMTMEQQLHMSVTMAIIEQVETAKEPVLVVALGGMALLLIVHVCSSWLHPCHAILCTQLWTVGLLRLLPMDLLEYQQPQHSQGQ